jgi:hypothetical protein
MPAAMAMAQSEPATNHFATSRRSSFLELLLEVARGLGFYLLQTQWVLRKSNLRSLSGSIPPRS